MFVKTMHMKTTINEGIVENGKGRGQRVAEMFLFSRQHCVNF